MTPSTIRAAAYAELRPTLGARQAEVLRLVAEHPGHTALELARIAKWGDPNRLRPRLVELVHAGYIEAAAYAELRPSPGPAAQGELGL